MTKYFLDALDIAIDRLTAGESLPDILADYPDIADDLRLSLETLSTLNVLQPVAMPSNTKMAANRTQFLQNVENSLGAAVSIGLMERLTGWMGQYFLKNNHPHTQKKEKQPMLQTFIVKASIIFTMVFGSAGGTAVVAAQSLPDSPLYPVKLAMETVEVNMVNSPAAKAMLHLDFAQERMQEILQLTEKGVPVDERTVEQLQQHLNLMMQFAEEAPEPKRNNVLLNAQTMLQQHLEILAQSGEGATMSPELMAAGTVLEQTQARIGAKNPTPMLPAMPTPVSPIATPTMMSQPTQMPGGGGGMQPPTTMPTMVPPTQMPGGGGGMPQPTTMPTMVPPTQMPGGGGGMQPPTEMPTMVPPTQMPGGGGGMPQPTTMPTMVPPTQMPGGGGGMQPPTTMPQPTEMPTMVPPTQMPGGGGGTQPPTTMPTMMPPTQMPGGGGGMQPPTTMPQPTEMPTMVPPTQMPGGGGGMQPPTAMPTMVPPTQMPGGGM